MTNKIRLCWRRFATLILAGTLVGCAAGGSASGVLSEEQARGLAALTPFEFIKGRFFDGEQTPVLDAVEGVARGYAHAIECLQGRRPTAKGHSPRADLSCKPPPRW